MIPITKFLIFVDKIKYDLNLVGKKNSQSLEFITKININKKNIKVYKKNEEISFFLGVRFLVSTFLKKIFYNIYGLNYRFYIKLLLCLFGCFFNIKVLQINFDMLYKCQLNLKNTYLNYDLQKKIKMTHDRLKFYNYIIVIEIIINYLYGVKERKQIVKRKKKKKLNVKFKIKKKK